MRVWTSELERVRGENEGAINALHFVCRMEKVRGTQSRRRSLGAGFVANSKVLEIGFRKRVPVPLTSVDQFTGFHTVSLRHKVVETILHIPKRRTLGTSSL